MKDELEGQIDTTKEAWLYYLAPSDEAFNEMKDACIAQWKRLDNTYGYVDTKLSLLPMENVKDNFMVMLAMFDPFNQREIMWELSEETKDEVRKRVISGGGTMFNV